MIDPDDLNAMLKAVSSTPEYGWVSLHKLWPASTMRDDWVWAHGRMDDITPVLSQRIEDVAQWWALGFTYTPAALLNAALPHMPAWVFGQVDNGLSAVARQHHIPVHVMRSCRPKHLHFYSREDDASWRPGLGGRRVTSG